MISVRAGVVVALVTASAAAPVPAQVPKDYTGNCTDAGCHDTFSKRAVIHPPAEPGGCDTCHEQPDEKQHRFKLTMEGGELCEDCHDSFEGKVQHPPVAEGQCTSCHDPHASDAKHLLLAETQTELCAECHEDFSDEHKFLHGPVAAGACTVCHQAHASEHAALLLAEGKALCDECHTTMKDRIDGGEFKHAPATEDCTACHSPHGADNRLNLKLQPPELCMDCHDEIEDILDEATVTHEAVTVGRACPNCHDPHASNVEHLLAKDPMDLCLLCHDKQVKSGNGKIMNMSRLLKDNPEHHGPIKHKNCTACHLYIHGGDQFRLLMKEYPPEFYAPFESERYALCFECHEPDLLGEERTDKLTNFRNGDHNLHFLHVNRKVKGRTCRACHNTHASRRPKHIRETVPFGKWELPVNYKKTSTGGSCLPGCHKLYRYDRDTPVVNISK